MLILDRRDRVTDVESEQSKAIVLCPWVENPYALVSWWDMEQFSAVAFYDIASELSYLQVALGQSSADELHGTHLFQPQGSAFVRLVRIRDECSKIGLKTSIKCVDYIIESGSKGTTTGTITQGLNELSRLIRWEMEDNLFLYVPSERAEYYGEQGGLGVDVSVKFPSAKFDIAEAGNCFALGRFTGCVFHLMRVLEIGLAALGKVFSVSLAHTNWHPAIEEIEKKVRDMGNDPNKAADWKDQQEYYSQAASHFMFLKDAWRNYTAHARGKYTDEEAKTIFGNVRAFMQKLSERLVEKGDWHG